LKTDAKKKTIIKYQPLGLIFTVNSYAEPLFQPVRSAISNLMLGNCVLSRSSTTTPNVSKIL
jgi:acyl-CoA reductase-like NAD-dependent aldehyde dehydrogenase